MIWLFMYALAISLYDLHTRRIPNWRTLPLLAAGVIAHFPSRPEVWFLSFALMYAWTGDWIGAGDVKLWLALLWAVPVEQFSHTPQVVCLERSFFIKSMLAKDNQNLSTRK